MNIEKVPPGGNRGAHLRAARGVLRESRAQFAARAGINAGSYRDIESGITASPSTRYVDAIVDALGDLPEGNPHAENAIVYLSYNTAPKDVPLGQQPARRRVLRDLLQPFEAEKAEPNSQVLEDPAAIENAEVDKEIDRKWLTTFARVRSLPLAVLCLRLEAGLKHEEIAEEAETSVFPVNKSRGGEKKITIQSANILYGAFHLPTDGLAIQYFRLLSQDMSPLDAESFVQQSNGEIVKHYRMLKGEFLEDAAKKIGISMTLLSRIEHNERSVSVATKDKILAWLGLPPEDPLAEALTAKLTTEVGPSKEQLEELDSENYLFIGQEDIAPPIPTRDRARVSQIVGATSIGAYIRQKRVELGLTQEEFAENVPAALTQSEITGYETGNVIPRPRMVYQIGRALGFVDIHDPKMLALVEKSEAEQVARKREIQERRKQEAEMKEIGGGSVLEVIMEEAGVEGEFAFDDIEVVGDEMTDGADDVRNGFDDGPDIRPRSRNDDIC